MAHERSYAERLVAVIGKMGAQHLSLTNVAQGSTRSIWALTLFEALLASEAGPPDLIIWEYGINDVFLCAERPEDEDEQKRLLPDGLSWDGVLTCSLEAFLRRLATLRQPPAVVFVFLWPCGLKPYQKRRPYMPIAAPLFERYRRHLPLLAIDANVALQHRISADCFPDQRSAPCVDSPVLHAALRSSDLCHPTAWSHMAIADAVLAAFGDEASRSKHGSARSIAHERGGALPAPQCQALRPPRLRAPWRMQAPLELGCPRETATRERPGKNRGAGSFASEGGATVFDTERRRSCDATIGAILRLRLQYDARAFLGWRPSASFDALMTLARVGTAAVAGARGPGVVGGPGGGTHNPGNRGGRDVGGGSGGEGTNIGDAHADGTRGDARRSGDVDGAGSRVVRSGGRQIGYGRPVRSSSSLLLPSRDAVLRYGLHASDRFKCGLDAKRIDCKFGLRLPCCSECLARPGACPVTFTLANLEAQRAERPGLARQPQRRRTPLQVHGAMWKVGANHTRAIYPSALDVAVVVTEHRGTGEIRRVVSTEAVQMQYSRCARTLDAHITGFGRDMWWLPTHPANLSSISFCALHHSALGHACDAKDNSASGVWPAPSEAYLHYAAVFYSAENDCPDC